MVFEAETFEDMAQQSHAHGTQMFQEWDEAHLEAMGKMQELMKDPEAMQAWFSQRKKEFDEMEG